MSLTEQRPRVPTTTARLAGADVVVAGHHEPAPLEQRLRAATAGGAFELAAIEPTLGGWRCRFLAADPWLALTWANVAELQVHLARVAEIVRVSRVDDADRWG